MKAKDVRDLIVIALVMAAIAYGAVVEKMQTCDGVKPNVAFCVRSEGQ